MGYVKGSIITNNGDTLNGLISTQIGNWLNTSFYYRPVKDDYGIIMKASDTKGYIFNKQTFISHNIHLKDRDTVAFVKVLFEGKYSLYSYDLPGHVHFIIKQPDGTSYDLDCPPELTVSQYQSGMTSEKQFHIILDSLFFKDDVMRQLAFETDPNKESMIKLFQKYYQKTNAYHNYPPRRGILLDAAAVAGVAFDRFNLDVPYKFKSYSDLSPYIGLNIGIKNKQETGLFLKETIAIKSHHYSYLVEETDIKSYYQTNLKALAANTEAGFRIHFLSKFSLKPYIEGGGVLSKYLNPKYENSLDKLLINQNTMFSYKNETDINNDFFYGCFLRIGVLKNLKQSGSFSLSAGYNYLKSQGLEKISSTDFSVSYIPKFK
jgi:hypothetical protein